MRKRKKIQNSLFGAGKITNGQDNYEIPGTQEYGENNKLRTLHIRRGLLHINRHSHCARHRWMSALRIASLCNVQFSFQLQNQNRRCHCTSDCSSSSWSLKSGSFSFTQKKMPHDVKTNPCRQDFRWVGGISHINSSQQSTFHWNTVEITSHGRTFYGTGLTATAAENNVRAKADLFTKIGMTHKDGTEKGEYAELLCGHAPVPGMLYKYGCSVGRSTDWLIESILSELIDWIE